jgi:hypothetical protein
MGTKIGLTGITFGDATVQNTAATTGVTSLVAGTGISVSGATGAVTVSATGGGTVTSVSGTNGLTGTVTTSGSLSVDTTFGNIGTYAVLQKFSTGTVIAGSTASGANLGYITAFNGGGNPFLEGNSRRAGNVSVPGAGKAGVYNNTTAVSGTWRSMSSSQGGGYNGDDNETNSACGMWIRIS